MSWPPADTPLYLVMGSGTARVLFRRATSDQQAEVSRPFGRRVYDQQARSVAREWALHTITVSARDLFATPDAARAEFTCRRSERPREVA